MTAEGAQPGQNVTVPTHNELFRVDLGTVIPVISATFSMCRRGRLVELHHLSNSHIRRELGERSRATRKSRGLNQTQLAERANLTRKTIGAFEKGHDVSLDSFLSILRALDMLDALSAAIPEPVASPMNELTSGNRATSNDAQVWTWGDEQP